MLNLTPDLIRFVLLNPRAVVRAGHVAVSMSDLLGDPLISEFKIYSRNAAALSLREGLRRRTECRLLAQSVEKRFVKIEVCASTLNLKFISISADVDFAQMLDFQSGGEYQQCSKRFTLPRPVAVVHERRFASGSYRPKAALVGRQR